MTIRSGNRSAVRPKASLIPCGSCPSEANCPHNNHWTQSGRCVIRAHNCPKFKAKDFKEVDHAIRKGNRQKFFGSTHERLALTDVELTMARGQSDVEVLERQVPIRLEVRGIVYIADAVATLKPGGKYTHRIYEPKGMKSLIYLFKRRIVELMYPEFEFFEIHQ